MTRAEIVDARRNAEELRGSWAEAYVHLANLYMIASQFEGQLLDSEQRARYREAESFIVGNDIHRGVELETRQVVLRGVETGPALDRP